MDLQKQIILQAPRWRRKGWGIMEKYYYAHFCRLGANAVSANNTRVFLGDYYAFTSKAARNKWVEENYFYESNVAVRACTRAEVVSQYGKHFFLIKPEHAVIMWLKTSPELVVTNQEYNNYLFEERLYEKIF